MTPVPTPIRPCQRYHANGLHCTTPTPRRDGWCGSCEGHIRPEPPSGASSGPVRAPGPRKPEHFPPLRPDEIPSLHVTDAALHQFIRHHGGGEASARTQIRSLIADIAAAPVKRGMWLGDRRRWLIGTREFAYTVTLSRSLAVVGYGTKHAERTWSEAKAKTRLPPRRHGNRHESSSLPPLWFRQALKAAIGKKIGDMKVTETALALYVRRRSPDRLRQSNVSTVLPVAIDAVKRALAAWDGQYPRVPDPDHPGSYWLLGERIEDPAVVSYITPDSVPAAERKAS